MAGVRAYLADFALANPLYASATITVYAVDPTTQKVSTTLAPLYADPFASTLLANPQTLDGEGKWQMPVYVDQAVIMRVGNAGAANGDTGIAGQLGSFRGDWTSGTLYFTGDTIRDGSSGLNSSNVYYCAGPHTSGIFADDLAAGVWLLYMSATSVAAGVIAQAVAASLVAVASAGYLTANQTITLSGAVAGSGSTGITVTLADSGVGASTYTKVTVNAKGIVTSGGELSNSDVTTALGYDPLPRAYLAGLTLSNDGGSPNTVLDIAAGMCIDSTAASVIRLGAFTKSTAGSWAVGSGSNGMGVGLTIANGTWYHVFAILNTGTPDVYFDTSVTAANKPVGTTVFRRLGSFKTDSSAHIVAFTQSGDYFWWSVPVVELANVVPGVTTAFTVTLGGVPTGLVVEAIMNGYVEDPSNPATVYFSALASADGVVNGSNFSIASPLNSIVGISGMMFLTNTSAQIRARSATAGATIQLNSLGWIDNRGRFA